MSEQALQPVAFKIDLPRLDDAAAICAAHQQAWRETYPDKSAGVSLAWVEAVTNDMQTLEQVATRCALLQEAIDNPDRIFYRVVKNIRGSEVYGFLHITRDEQTAELCGLYLTDQAKGTGAAQQAMQQGVDFIGDLPAHLQVADYNHRAIRFYKRYGFVVEPGSRESYRDTFHIVTMRRPANYKEEAA